MTHICKPDDTHNSVNVFYYQLAIATKNIRHVPSNLSPTNETKMSRSSSADWYLTPESLQHGCLTTRPLPADLFAQRSYTALRKHPADRWMLPREVQQAEAFTHTGGGGGILQPFLCFLAPHLGLLPPYLPSQQNKPHSFEDFIPSAEAHTKPQHNECSLLFSFSRKGKEKKSLLLYLNRFP